MSDPRAAIAEAIVQAIDPRSASDGEEVRVAIYVDDFTRHLADCGYKVVPADDEIPMVSDIREWMHQHLDDDRPPGWTDYPPPRDKDT